MTRGDAVTATGRVTVGTGGVTWLATSSLGTAFARALGPLDATRVVLPDTDLASASGRTPTLGQPFDLELGHNRSVLAAASDGELATHFAPSAAKDPALAATQLLADLALVHYEAPSPNNAPRGLVAVPPADWVPNPTFDDTLLAGLENNPNVAPVTLATLFAEVPVGGNGWPADRVLATSGPGPVMGPGLAHRVAAARLRLTAFAGAVSGAQAIVNGLDDRLLAAQSLALRPAGQAHGVAAFERSLSDQLSLISLATERTVTLTSRTATIPVTILSAAHYTVQGTLTLASDKLVFPPPGPTRLHVVIDHPTNAVRFQVVARTSGDLPLSVTFVSPNRGLVLAHGELTVRSTATSIVGVVLTLAAAAVLLGWWARTWRARRRARRPRRRDGRAGGGGEAMSELIGASADPSLPPGEGPAGSAGGHGSSLRRATVWMAAGTALSRLTGVGRVLALAYALGFSHLADAYNLANTTPNMLYDIVLGGVLSATFIPVFVDRLATRSEREAWRAISAVVTLPAVVLVGPASSALAAAPLSSTPSPPRPRHTAPSVPPAGRRTGGGHHAAAVVRPPGRPLRVHQPGRPRSSTPAVASSPRCGCPSPTTWCASACCCGSASVADPHPSLVAARLNPHQLVLLGLGTTLGVARPGPRCSCPACGAPESAGCAGAGSPATRRCAR